MTPNEVKYLNGNVEIVNVIPADLVDFERRYGCSMDRIDPVLQEHGLYLAYTATLRSSRRSIGTFSHWMETVASVTTDEA